VWTSSTVDENARSSDVSLAFTPEGRPAIAYSGALIKYAVFDSGQWIIESVIKGGESPSLGFDSSGSPMIVYGSRSPLALMCARRSASGWKISKITDWGYSPSLAFTPAGDPAIAYIDLVYDAAVKYAVYKNGWKHYVVDRPVKQQAARNDWYYWYYPSLAFNPVTGEPAIAYFQYDTSCIKYAVGRVFPRGLGDLLSDLIAALSHLVSRGARSSPPPSLPTEPERFQRDRRDHEKTGKQ
jgi:hypothetical protein